MSASPAGAPQTHTRPLTWLRLVVVVLLQLRNVNVGTQRCIEVLPPPLPPPQKRHKARYPYPGGQSHPNAIDAPYVKHIGVEAGDVLIFLASGVPHGVISWRGEHERRCPCLRL